MGPRPVTRLAQQQPDLLNGDHQLRELLHLAAALEAKGDMHRLCANGNKSWISARSSWDQSNSTEREKSYVQRGKLQLDDAYQYGEQNGDKPGLGSENKVSIVAAVSLDEAGHRIHLKVAKVETYSFAAIAYCAQDALAHCTARHKRLLRGAELGT